MRQIVLNSSGAMVARVPRPIVERGSVLVRVHYSLISVGTEVAPLRRSSGGPLDSTTIERSIEYASLARHYFRASLRDPRKAMNRVAQIARRRMAAIRPRASTAVAVIPVHTSSGIDWTAATVEARLTAEGDTVMSPGCGSSLMAGFQQTCLAICKGSPNRQIRQKPPTVTPRQPPPS